MDLVSVIMPAFNAESYLVEAVESVLAQSYVHWELWIIDDGSTDRTLELARSFDDPRVQVHPQPHQGISAARNHGLSLAQGEWIAFLDADDIWLGQKLEKQLALASGQEVLVYSDYLTLQGTTTTHIDPFRLCPDFSREGSLFRQLIQHDFIGTLTVLLPKKAVQQVGFFDEQLNAPGDWDYWIRLSEQFSWVYLCEPVAIYRNHPAGISKDYASLDNDLLVVCERYLLKQGTQSEIRFGLWAYFRHMAHHYARNGQGGEAWDRWKKAVSQRFWDRRNGASFGFLVLQGLRTFFR